jgi:hypothetical protein
MTQKIATLAAIGLLVFGCSRSGKMQRKQQDYQAVQEGSASGVTSTINAPGETTPPMTNTNVDTTTNLTLPTNPAPLGNDTAGGSMASGMPTAPAYPAGTPGLPPSSRPRPPARTTNAPVVTDTIGSTTPAMPRERAPQPAPREPRPQTDTAATDTTATPPPSTDTTMTDTSSTSTSTDAKKKKDSDQPPPPPPPTDTRG